jgi:hypothetical protein
MKARCFSTVAGGLAVVAILCATPPYCEGASSALRFMTDGQWCNVADCPALDVTGHLTVEAWVKPDILANDYWFKFIVSKELDGTGYALLATGDCYQFEANTVTGGAANMLRGNTPMAFGLWTHVAGVWDGSEVKLYINGRLDASGADPYAPVANNFPLWIGSSPFGNDTIWRGDLDEVRIWAKAKSQSEIQEQMNLSLTGQETGLRGYWRLDEGGGEVIADTVGQCPNGDLGAPPDNPDWVPGLDLLTVTVSRSGFRYNRATRRFVQDITVRNFGSVNISGPVLLVLDDLSANATLFRAMGFTSAVSPLGSPYVTLNLGGAGTLAAGQSVVTTVEFVNPSLHGITYTARVLAGPWIEPALTDVTSGMAITRSGYRFQISTQRFLQNVSIQNIGSAGITGPVSLVLDDLSANATCFGATGVTSAISPLGSPYYDLNLGTSAVLAPGQTVTVTLQFEDPTKTGITYNTRVLAGPGTR